MQVPFSFLSGARVQISKVAKQASSVRWRGHQHLWDLEATPRWCNHTRFENANASSEWNFAKGPQHLRPLAGQALHVIRYVGHREQTCANRVLGSILA